MTHDNSSMKLLVPGLYRAKEDFAIIPYRDKLITILSIDCKTTTFDRSIRLQNVLALVDGNVRFILLKFDKVERIDLSE